MKNKIIITGINGFIGSQIAEILVKQGHEVMGLVRKKSRLDNLNNIKIKITLFEGDIRDAKSLRPAFNETDVCYHTAALAKVGSHSKEEYFSTNLQGTINACSEAMRAGIKKFVYTSTCETLRGNSYSAMLGDYGRSKFLAEEHVKACVQQGLPAVTVNPTAVIGPGDINLTPPNALLLAYCNGKIPVYFDTGFNIVDVRDVAIGHVRAAEKGKIGERYILGNENIMLSKLFAILRETAGKRPITIKLPYWLIAAATKVLPIQNGWREKIRASRLPFFLDHSKAINELGWQPLFDLRQSIRDTLC